MSQDVLFWTFSSIIQAFVALAAFMGMVGIYKLQIIHNRMELLAEKVRAAFYPQAVDEYSTLSPQDIVKLYEALSDKEKSQLANEVHFIVGEIERLLEKQEKIKNDIIHFIKYVVVTVLCALVFLVCIPPIYKYHLDIPCLLIVTFLSFYCLNLTYKLSRAILGIE